MKDLTRYLVITLLVGIPATALSLVIWPPAPGITPSPVQLVLFLGIFAAEGLLFGFGVAFLLLGMPLVRRAAMAAGVRTIPVYLSIVWTLVSWWPHDGMHRASGLGDVDAVLRVDYAFHLTLIVAALVIARFFLATVRAATPSFERL